MKYLKLFESFVSKEELIQDAKDICLELNDANIKTDCYYNNPYVSGPGFITVGIERFEGDGDRYDEFELIEWHEVEEVVDRLVDYFESNDWILTSILMDGDNLIDPKDWIKRLRNKDSYKFSGLTINFVKN